MPTFFTIILEQLDTPRAQEELVKILMKKLGRRRVQVAGALGASLMYMQREGLVISNDDRIWRRVK